MYEVVLKKTAQKELLAIPQKIRQRIAKGIDELSEYGIKARDTKKLKDPLHGYRKRVGKYRILFDTENKFILIQRISKRSDVYR